MPSADQPSAVLGSEARIDAIFIADSRQFPSLREGLAPHGFNSIRGISVAKVRALQSLPILAKGPVQTVSAYAQGIEAQRIDDVIRLVATLAIENQQFAKKGPESHGWPTRIRKRPGTHI